MWSRASGKETWLDDCGTNPKSQHPTGEQGLNGGVESDADGKGFYYLGEGKIVSDSVREEIIGKKTAVGMNIELQHPLETKMYDLLFTE